MQLLGLRISPRGGYAVSWNVLRSSQRDFRAVHAKPSTPKQSQSNPTRTAAGLGLSSWMQHRTPLQTIPSATGNSTQLSVTHLGLLQVLPPAWSQPTPLAMWLESCSRLAFKGPDTTPWCLMWAKLTSFMAIQCMHFSPLRIGLNL